MTMHDLDKPQKSHTPLDNTQIMAMPEGFIFETISEQATRITYGLMSFDLNMNGTFAIQNGHASCHFTADGGVQIQGAQITVNSEKNIELNAKQSIYFKAK
jgi:hypothetical protein